MLLQTNSYVVPRDKRAEHARLLAKFKQALSRIGCEHFEVYEQVGANWSSTEHGGRFVQILRFKDRKQHSAIQAAEKNDPVVQELVREFCKLINFPYQQQQGLYAAGFYNSVVPPSDGLPPEVGIAETDSAATPAEPLAGDASNGDEVFVAHAHDPVAHTDPAEPGDDEADRYMRPHGEVELIDPADSASRETGDNDDAGVGDAGRFEVEPIEPVEPLDVETDFDVDDDSEQPSRLD